MDEVTPRRGWFSHPCACYKCGSHITYAKARSGTCWMVSGNPFCSESCAQWLADEVNRIRKLTEAR